MTIGRSRRTQVESEGAHSRRRKALDRRRLLLEQLEKRELLDGVGGTDPERLIVRFAPGTSDQVAQQWAEQQDVTITNRLRSVFNGAVVELPDGQSPADAVATMEQAAIVMYAEPEQVGEWSITPNDPQFGSQWGLHNTGQTGGTADADIDAPEAWDLITDSSNVVVGIVDSGTNYNHPDLAPVMWRNPGEVPNDGIDNDGNGFIDDVFGIDSANGTGDPQDGVGHGTHVSGIAAAAGNNNLGVSGTNWNARIMALNIGNPLPTSVGAISALDYMVLMKSQFGVNVVSSNHSYTIGASQAFFDSIQASNDAGIVFVAAAGNATQDIELSPSFPASYPHAGIITVAATDHDDVIAGFSNFGSTSVDLGAPGVNIQSTMLTSGQISDPSGYGAIQGTSMAAPFVAGAAGLLAARNPTASVAEIKAALLSTVDPVPTLAGVTVTGGRLNLFQAVTAIGGPSTVSDEPLPPGPRLVGVQPNNSDLFSLRDATKNVRDVGLRELTLRFHENQKIDAASLFDTETEPDEILPGGVRIFRSGGDGVFGNANDVAIEPGFLGVGDSPNQNEVTIRFAETLPDDVYRVEVLGIGSTTPLTNEEGGLFIPTLTDNDGDDTKDTVQFELDLGPQVIAVVPQPVTRDNQGGLVQARNQIQVFFNEDDLFVENDDLFNPTQASAENPDFYQLIYTADTVRNTDDTTVYPTDVAYDPVANMATLTFANDLDQLLDPDTGELIGPGTFRLRIGTDEAAPLPPLRMQGVQHIASDFNTGGRVVLQFTSVRPGEQDVGVLVTRNNLGDATEDPRVLVNVVEKTVLIGLNQSPSNTATARDVVNAVNSHPAARRLVAASVNMGDPDETVGDHQVDYSPLTFNGLGSSFDTATDLSDGTDLGATIVVTGSGNALRDGDFFTVDDRAGTRRKFEFDRDVPSATNDPISIAIPVTDNTPQFDVASAIVRAINDASFGVTASLAGSTVKLEGEGAVDLSSASTGLRKAFASKFDAGSVLEITRG